MIDNPLAKPFDPMCACNHSLFHHLGTKGGRCLVCPCAKFANKETACQS